MAEPRPGRPRRSSPQQLEDAAEELFLEGGYAGTSIDDIATRAGVSRATFFNYFGSKSDLLWVSFDRSAGDVALCLARATTAADADDPIERVVAALIEASQAFGPDRVPWAVTGADLMGTGPELAASGLERFRSQTIVIEHFLREHGTAALRARVAAFALVASVAAAATEWIAAGVSRSALAEYVAAALAELRSGLTG